MRALIICMKERLEAGRALAQALERSGLSPTLVDAVVGKDEAVLGKARGLLGLQTLAHLGRPRLAHSWINVPGAIGCYLSHIKCWEMVAAQTEPVVVVEEDFALDPFVDLPRVLSAAEASVRQGLFDLVSFAYCHAPMIRADSDELVRVITPFFGTQGYVVGPRGARKLLETLGRKIEGHVDAMLGLLALASAQDDEPFLLGVSSTNCFKEPELESLITHDDAGRLGLDPGVYAAWHKQYYKDPWRYDMASLAPRGKPPGREEFSL
jgi:GR25 family glycosyltransferase involved in LPS biosynthesis